MSEEITKSEQFSGKIAVATNDGIRITGHIGRCRSFLVVELSGDKIIKKELRENVFTNHRTNGGQHNHGEGPHNHTLLINSLNDCSYLISAGGGWRVVEDLKQNNIASIFTDIDLIEDAINQFIKGGLKNDSGLVCNHHEN